MASNHSFACKLLITIHTLEDGANRPARIESSKASVSCKGSSAYFCRTRSQVLQLAAAEGIFAGAPWRKINESNSYSCGGRKTPLQHEPNPTGSPAQPANQILRCGCCNNPRMTKASFPLIAPKMGPSKIFHQLIIF